MNYEYKGMETPEERLRNKLQALFGVLEIIHQTGECHLERVDKAIKLLPEIKNHLEDIEEFYGNNN